ncbi:antitoxin VapB family protein [Candidatus Woesearchaeota archaeon]|nr:antitoxin VapB family protein [Candidatus Woesearchaeota archaeon]
MGTKTISIMDDAYELLVRNKKTNESFSQELRRILPKKRSIMEFAGAWADVTEEEAERMKKTIMDYRRNSSKRTKERFFGK